MIRALVFDFDGLIVDTESPYVQAWEHLHHEAGLKPPARLAHALVGHVNVDLDLWIAFGPGADRATLQRRFVTDARQRNLRQPVLPGVRNLLVEARAAGWRTAVASNSDEAHVRGHLDRRDLTPLFDVIVTRECAPRPKPAPDLYTEAVRRLGVPAADAVAFEDSDPGHRAAASAGLRCVVVPNPATRHVSFPLARARLETLEGLTLMGLSDLVDRG
jgi:putative hydrolase of the HAD superfamily